jgi:hypothetical protein
VSAITNVTNRYCNTDAELAMRIPSFTLCANACVAGSPTSGGVTLFARIQENHCRRVGNKFQVPSISAPVGGLVGSRDARSTSLEQRHRASANVAVITLEVQRNSKTKMTASLRHASRSWIATAPEQDCLRQAQSWFRMLRSLLANQRCHSLLGCVHLHRRSRRSGRHPLRDPHAGRHCCP